jgi:gamma-glutamyltranspeptidase
VGETLGHGMSRFEVQPARPNAPGPVKQPLNNMRPTIVSRGGALVLATGAAGSRTIVNAVFSVRAQFVGLNASVEDATAAPRLHTGGSIDLTVEAATPGVDVEFLGSIRFRVQQAYVANANALMFDSERRAARAAAR